MLSFARAVSLVIAVVVVAACDASDAPTAPSQALTQPRHATSAQAGGVERDVVESLYDLTDSKTQIACEDGRSSELIALEGQIYERFTVLYNPSGAMHASYHTMPVGLRGVGTVSGEEYRVKEQEHGSYTQTLMGATGSYRQIVRLSGRTSGRSFSLVARGHYTINANGDIAVQRENVLFTCDA